MEKDYINSLYGTIHGLDVAIEKIRELNDRAPTIKMGDKRFKCVKCGESSSGDAWNYATRIYFGGYDIVPIEEPHAQDAFFICPKCGEENGYHGLEE